MSVPVRRSLGLISLALAVGFVASMIAGYSVYDPERRARHHAESLGVKLYCDYVEGVWLRKPVTWITFQGEHFTDEHLTIALNFPHARGVRIDGTGVAGEGLSALAGLPALRKLVIGSGSTLSREYPRPVDAWDLALLLHRRPELELDYGLHFNPVRRDGERHPSPIVALDLGRSRITDDEISTLTKTFPNLRELSLGGTAVTSQALPDLIRLRRLEWLKAPDTFTMTDTLVLSDHLPTLGRGVHQPPSKPRLLWNAWGVDNVTNEYSGDRNCSLYHFERAGGTPEGRISRVVFDWYPWPLDADRRLEGIGRLTEVREVSISGAHLSEKGFQEIARLTNLEVLQIRGNLKDITGVEVRHLASLGKLRELWLTESPWMSSIIPELVKIPSLEILSLKTRDVQIYEPWQVEQMNEGNWSPSVSSFSGLKKLRHRDITSTRGVGGNLMTTSSAALEQLREDLPDCNVVCNDLPGNIGFVHVEPVLRRGEETLSFPREAIQQGFLGQLHYRYSGRFGNRSDSPLSHLNFYKSALTDEWLERLAGREEIVALELGETAITDRALKAVSTMKNLTYLGLFDTAISDEGIQLLGELPQLKLLMLKSTRISDHGLDTLSKMGQLEEIVIGRDESVTPEGVARFRAVLPTCRIVF